MATGSGAINESVTFRTENVVVIAVTLGLDTACATSENLVISNGFNGALYYDADFDTQVSLVWLPYHAPILNKDDNTETLDITFANSDANTWILLVEYNVVGR